VKRIILTGFGPFGAYRNNPTEILARTFDGQTVSGFLIKSIVLPASMEVVWGLSDGICPVIREVRKNDVAAIVSFGLSSCVRGFRVESVCKNWVYHLKYCRQEENSSKVVCARPERETLSLDLSRWDLSRMRSDFQERKIPMEQGLSSNADTFCCNAFMYKLGLALRQFQNAPPFLFLHTSCTKESVAEVQGWDTSKTLISQEQLEDGFRIILSCLR
jgi:pyrrolidone-carboxylate peptidase